MLKSRGRVIRRKHKDLPKGLKDIRVKVGYPRAKTDSGIIEIAIYNHFGTSTVPARPWLSNALRGNRAKYRRLMRDLAKKALNGDVSMDTIAEFLGQQAVGDIQKEMTNLRTPPNAPSTIRQKGSSNPLIDTGAMRGATTYEVKK